MDDIRPPSPIVTLEITMAQAVILAGTLKVASEHLESHTTTLTAIFNLLVVAMREAKADNPEGPNFVR